MDQRILARWPQLATYGFHPYAAIMPLPIDNYDEFTRYIESEEFSSFAWDIRNNGLKEAIVLYQGMILSGRRRFCVSVVYPDVELHFEDFKGNEKAALGLSASVNMMRRNLTDSQKAIAANRIYNLELEILTPKERETLEKVAQRYNIHVATMRHANQLMKSNRLELISAVDLDILPLRKAIDSLKLPQEIVQQILDGEKVSSQLDQALRNESRRERERQFSNKVIKENRDKEVDTDTMLFGVIYIDPPWGFKTYSDAGKDRSPDQHYPTMTDEEIAALQLPTAEDCALFLWTTVAKLDDAINILQGWGFDYRSAYFWHKLNKGLGYWSRNEMEILLLGIKESKSGNIPAPSPELQMPQVVVAKQTEHSAKPEVFGEGIAKMFPNIPSLEMFARHKANRGSNWIYRGNEIDGSDLRELTHNGGHSDKVAENNGNGKRRNGRKKNETPGPAPGEAQEKTPEEGVSP